jgi:hypothetical protein
MEPRLIALADLCLQNQIEILYVFGSRAVETKGWIVGKIHLLSTGSSDLDVGVKPALGSPFTVHDKVRLALALEDMFGVWRVDLVSFRDADPFLAANIIRGERLYARDETEADEFDLYILRRAGDLAPLERERLALILEKKG